MDADPARASPIDRVKVLDFSAYAARMDFRHAARDGSEPCVVIILPTVPIHICGDEAETTRE